MKTYPPFLQKISRVCVLVTLFGCATSRKEEGPNSVEELRTQVSTLQSKIDALEGQLNSVNDKADGTKANLEIYMSRNGLKPTASTSKSEPVAVKPAPSERGGLPVMAAKSEVDPDSDFESTDASQTFRKAMVLFKASKFPEASLAFSNFVERYPDHPFAGNAQYYSGASYLRQGEYKLALQEYQRVLTSFDRSPRVSDTLRDLVVVYESLKQPEEVKKNKQLLATLFANSPAARELKEKPLPQELPQTTPKAEPGLDQPPLTAPSESH